MIGSWALNMFSSIPDKLKQISENFADKLKSVRELDRYYFSKVDDDSINIIFKLESRESSEQLEGVKHLIAVNSQEVDDNEED